MLPFIRLTVLGHVGSGKTSLINSFVNNYSPQQHHPTPGPSLYYKLCHLPQQDDVKAAPTSVVIEIEDTFGSNRTDDGRDASVFFDMRRKAKINNPGGAEDLAPFSVWKPPSIPLTAKEPYRPLTQGRMGFLIVFDVNDQSSLEEAQRINNALREYLDNNTKMRIRPIVYFVGNKIDSAAENASSTEVIAAAETYTQRQMMRLTKVSAVTAKNVKRTFHDIARLVVGNDVLWEIEWEEEEEEEEEDAAFCSQS
eukprot:Lankesteria_metandrocarpae@DN10496_c0_g1_i1.p1